MTDGPAASSAGRAVGGCPCGAVRVEFDRPAVWAWHDHSRATQQAQGCAYATFVGVWRSKVRVTKGAPDLTRYEDPSGFARSFCSRCGAPIFYDRPRAPKMVNIPRALFETRTGREALYHLSLEEAADWEYRGEALSPLKGYPGVMRERMRRKKRGVGI
ncbi:MAG: GFA family protein [Caulobacteraceae bacterium]